MSEDRRRLLRIPINAVVRLRWRDPKEPDLGTVKNISGSGILIAAGEKFDTGAKLQIEVFAEPDAKPLSALVRVVWVASDGPPFDLAVEFLTLDLP